MKSCLKKLVIGTAQFGQNYGITNDNGQVSIAEAKKILIKAREHNILTLDTAGSYGVSESILGDIGVNNLEIITKLPSVEARELKLVDFYEETLKSSLKNLQVTSVNTVLLHRPEELLGKHSESIYEALNNLKVKGYTKRIGISIYSPDILGGIVDRFQIDTVQVPINFFDRRIITSGWLKKLYSMGVSVIARSIFLQGLLLSKVENLPVYFYPWVGVFKDWHNFCKDNKVSLLEASIRFVAQIPEVNKIIIGVENNRQFSEILDAFNNFPLKNSDQLAIDDINLISPTNWKV
ncbi:aldo/keto reductase [Alphaproteobacteria bacterium]|nr:aldo/keto reductase [Alphaproteobacteria bacterium]